MVEMRRFELLMLSHLGLNQAPIPIRVHLHTGEGLVLQNPQIYEFLLDSLTAYLRPLAWRSHPPSLSAICTPSQQWEWRGLGYMHPYVSSLGLWAINTGGISTPRAPRAAPGAPLGSP